MTDIAKIDEKQAVMEAFSPLCEFLPEFVRDCTANIKKDLASYKRLSARQKSRIAACLINMNMAKEWKEFHPVRWWEVDNSGFFHLVHTPTGAISYFHAVDPITRGMPCSGHTLAGRARCSQKGAKGVGQLMVNVLGQPDLSEVKLTIACDYLFPEPAFLRVYKPISPGKYGAKGTSAYSFPIMSDGDGGRGWMPGFDPEPDDEIDILKGLTIEEKVGC